MSSCEWNGSGQIRSETRHVQYIDPLVQLSQSTAKHGEEKEDVYVEERGMNSRIDQTGIS